MATDLYGHYVEDCRLVDFAGDWSVIVESFFFFQVKNLAEP